MSRLIHYSVWATWFLCTSAVFAFVRSYSSPLPVHDEWYYVEYATGHESFTGEFLWQQHNEHRIPWAKLFTFPLLWIFQCDYRAVMYFNVGVLSSAAAVLLGAITRRHGHLRLVDAAVPLSTFSLNPENMLWAFQLAFFQFLWFCAMVWAVMITRPPGPMSARRMLLLGAVTLLLPGTGGPGLGLLPGLWLWLIFESYTAAKARSYHSMIIAIVVIMISALSVLAYFNLDYHHTVHQQKNSILEFFRTFMQVVGNAPGSFQLQVTSHESWSWLGLGTALVILFSVIRVIRHRMTLGCHWLPLLGLIGGMLSLAAGIAYSRTGGIFGMAPRYHTLMIPLVWSLLIVWRSSPVAGWILLLLSSLAFVFGANLSLEESRLRKAVDSEIKAIITLKAPVTVIAEQIERVKLTPEMAKIDERLMMLQQRDAPYLAKLNGDQSPLPSGQPLASVIRLSPASVQQTLRLERPSRPLALRLKYTLNRPSYCVAYLLGRGPESPTPNVSRWILFKEPKLTSGTATLWFGREVELQEFIFVLLNRSVEIELDELEMIP